MTFAWLPSGAAWGDACYEAFFHSEKPRVGAGAWLDRADLQRGIALEWIVRSASLRWAERGATSQPFGAAVCERQRPRRSMSALGQRRTFLSPMLNDEPT